MSLNISLVITLKPVNTISVVIYKPSKRTEMDVSFYLIKLYQREWYKLVRQVKNHQRWNFDTKILENVHNLDVWCTFWYKYLQILQWQELESRKTKCIKKKVARLKHNKSGKTYWIKTKVTRTSRQK